MPDHSCLPTSLCMGKKWRRAHTLRENSGWFLAWSSTYQSARVSFTLWTNSSREKQSKHLCFGRYTLHFSLQSTTNATAAGSCRELALTHQYQRTLGLSDAMNQRYGRKSTVPVHVYIYNQITPYFGAHSYHHYCTTAGRWPEGCLVFTFTSQ